MGEGERGKGECGREGDSESVKSVKKKEREGGRARGRGRWG